MKQILIAIDQLVNTLFGGWADETVSSMVWRKKHLVMIKIINAIFFWESNHCQSSYINERQRMHLPPEFRD